MNEKLANAIKAQANEARLNKKMVLKDLKQLMEGLIQQIEDDRIWISDLKSLQSNLNLAVAQIHNPYIAVVDGIGGLAFIADDSGFLADLIGCFLETEVE